MKLNGAHKSSRMDCNIYYFCPFWQLIYISKWTYPESMSEPCAGDGTRRTDIAADSWILIGCCIQVCHWPRAAGAQEASGTWVVGTYGKGQAS